MVMQDNRRSSAIGTVRGAAGPARPEAPVRRTGGVVSAVLRGTAAVLLLNFDQFTREVGRGFLIAAVVLAVPLLLHEILRPSSRARTVIFWVLVVFGVLALPGFLHPRRPTTAGEVPAAPDVDDVRHAGGRGAARTT
ncbi:hypothetical protein V2I01_27735 [Micromonospora sp. BRA006-A]|nr:hypothetical protein [Micromonospora sp. BRA006-A]